MKGRLIVAALLAMLAASPAAGDNFYSYEKDGKTWWGNYCPPGAKKCRLVMKGTPSATGKVPGGSGTTVVPGGGGTKPDWRPPAAVTKVPAEVPDEASRSATVDEIIVRAAETYRIPEPFIRAVIEVESNYKPKALSYKGAMGYMQLMPGTAADMGVTDPWDAYQNIMGGTRFLRLLANRFQGDIPKVLAAYHAGGSSVAKADGIPYQGSDGYVRKVLDHYYRLKHSVK